MVKGISRQVIVVQSPEPDMFEQAIFILKDKAVGVTDEELLRQAKGLLHSSRKKKRLSLYGPVWACGGALVTAGVWLLTALF
ncbi:MAG: translation initiation factor 2 [Oscillospiraceae bacterium]|nr:translation initiation factor 2 [Oscillospiraceae bacterium]